VVLAKPAFESDPEARKNNELSPPDCDGEHVKENFNKGLPSDATGGINAGDL
jgi:hypothetical protein